MQKFETLRQPLIGFAVRRKKKKKERKNIKNSGNHLL
jgi:hypothetical protein